MQELDFKTPMQQQTWDGHDIRDEKLTERGKKWRKSFKKTEKAEDKNKTEFLRTESLKREKQETDKRGVGGFMSYGGWAEKWEGTLSLTPLMTASVSLQVPSLSPSLFYCCSRRHLYFDSVFTRSSGPQSYFCFANLFYNNQINK